MSEVPAEGNNFPEGVDGRRKLSADLNLRLDGLAIQNPYLVLLGRALACTGLWIIRPMPLSQCFGAISMQSVR